MIKSKKVLDKLGKFLEQAIVNYKDIGNELINICKSKRNDFIFKMRITGKRRKKKLRRQENFNFKSSYT